jgi:hypothetical protein
METKKGFEQSSELGIDQDIEWLQGQFIDDKLDTLSNSVEYSDEDISEMIERFDEDYKDAFDEIVRMFSPSIHPKKLSIDKKIQAIRAHILEWVTNKDQKKKMEVVFEQALREYEPMVQAYKAYLFHPLTNYFKQYKDLREILVANYKEKWTDQYEKNVSKLLINKSDELNNRRESNPIEDFLKRKSVATRSFMFWLTSKIQSTDAVFMKLASMPSKTPNNKFGATMFEQLNTLLKFYINDAVLFGRDMNYETERRWENCKWLHIDWLSRKNISIENPLTWDGNATFMDVDVFLKMLD